MSPNNPRSQADTSSVQVAAHSLGVEVVLASARSESELDAAYASLTQRSAGALIIMGDAFFLHAIKRLAALAVRHRIAAIFTSRQYAEAGGLMTYGASVTDSFRQAGVYTSRVLKGEKPGDLPIMQPTRLELVINFKAAKVIGLEVLPHLQQLADDVIE